MTDTTSPAPDRGALAAGYAALAAELGDLDLQFAAESHAGMTRVLAAETLAEEPGTDAAAPARHQHRAVRGSR